jgi:hypothetical protein
MSHTPLDPPALERPISEADDPHKGCFGGKDSVGGFKLAVEFTDGKDDKLSESSFPFREKARKLRRRRRILPPPDFRPDRLRAAFHGRRAEVRIVSRGSFTVGVWLPKHSVELELDPTRTTARAAPKRYPQPSRCHNCGTD